MERIKNIELLNQKLKIREDYHNIPKDIINLIVDKILINYLDIIKIIKFNN